MLSMLLSSHLVYIAVVPAEMHADESFVIHMTEGVVVCEVLNTERRERKRDDGKQSRKAASSKWMWKVGDLRSHCCSRVRIFWLIETSSSRSVGVM